MMKILIDVEVLPDGGITEEFDLVCCMTGFRTRMIRHHLGNGVFRSAILGAS